MTLIPWKAFVFRRRLMVIQVTMHEYTDSWNFEIAFYIDSHKISWTFSSKSVYRVLEKLYFEMVQVIKSNSTLLNDGA